MAGHLPYGDIMYCVAFAGGCYGNFIAWTLQWLQGNYAVDFRPFDNRRGSHNWLDTHRDNVQRAVAEPINGCIVHPIVNSDDTIGDSFRKLLTVYDKIVAPYPGLNDFVWVLNNRQTKIYEQGWIDKNQSNFDLSAWNNREPWALREFLSYYLHDQLITESGYHDLNSNTDDRVLSLQINILRDRFVDTLYQLCEWLDIKIVRRQEDIELLHSDWLNNEQYLNKDRLINSYIHATITDKKMNMENCTIMDQATMQHALRKQGYEIKCHGLNNWPKTTTELKTLIYEAEGI